MEPLYRCPKCLQELPSIAFHKNKRTKSGLHARCKSCRKEEGKKERQGPRYQERVTTYRLNNKERIAQHRREYSAANREHIRAREQRYRITHAEEIRAWTATYNRTPARKEYVRQWHKAKYGEDRERYYAYGHSRRARIRMNGPVEHLRRDEIYTRDQGICSLCHKKVARKDMSLDHIIPLAKGGTHTYKNVALVHRRCNSRKCTRALPQQQRLF